MFGMRTIAITKTVIAQAVTTFVRNLVLSLKGDSAYTKNQNNTILDRSVNELAITRAGDATQSTASFSPFSGPWSYYFDGTGEYLTAPVNSTLDFGTGDFTVEGWWNTPALTSTAMQTVGINAASVASNSDIGFFTYLSSTLCRVAICNSGTQYNIDGWQASVKANVWQHFAFVRQSGVLTFYIDGEPVGSIAANVAVNYNAAWQVRIGTYSAAATRYFTGYMSNIRIVAGAAVYTAAFTPPTSVLTVISNTSLLTCHAGRLFDGSTNSFSISVSGDTKASTFSPFIKTTLSGTVGSTSVLFNGSSDYLSVPNSTALNFMAGDYTVEAWINPTALPPSATYGGAIITNTSGSNGWELRYTTAARIAVVYPGIAGYDIAAAGSVPIGAWTHVAVVKSGTTVRAYINGAQYSVATSSPAETNLAWKIGYSGFGYFSGRISNLRIIKGTALYTAAFTPPTAELTAVSGTSLLTCLGNSISDSSSNNAAVTFAGTPRVSSQNPFGSGSGWSGYFDGTGDYLTAPINSTLDFGTGDFTVEGWWNTPALTATPMQPVGMHAAFVASNADVGFIIYLSSTLCRVAIANGNTAYVIDGWQTSVKANAWQHFAYVRQSGVLKFYIDGVQVGTVAANVDVNYNAAWQVRIGNYADNTSRFFNGSLSNIRIVAGTAVYTTAFTPPTTALTAVSGTSLLTLQDNTFKDNSSNAFAITQAGDAAVRAVGPFGAGNIWSGYFDGTGDYLTLPVNQSGLLFGSSDFTIEAWVYRVSGTGNAAIFLGQSNLLNAAGSSYVLYVTSTATTSEVYVGAGSFGVTSPNPAVGVWSHVALVRTGGTLSTYLNGSRVGTRSDLGTASVNDGSTTNPPSIGAFPNGGSALHGYISNLRVIKGSGGYDATAASISVPTTPLTAVTNTSLLTLQGNTFKDNSNNAIAITRAGDARAVAEGPFAATFPSATAVFPGSIYFDGTNDYLTIPASANLNLFGGDFTIECWFNPTTLNASGYNYIMMQDDGANPGQNFQLLVSAAGVASFASFTSSARSSVFAVNSAAGAVKLGAWNHIAVTNVRSSNTTRLFVNGALAASSTSAIWAGATLPIALGNFSTGPAQTATYAKLNGHLSGVRIIKGTAVYTAAFSVPTAPPIATADTSLLLNFNNGAVIDAYGPSSAGVLTTIGNAGTDGSIKKFGTRSLYFDGTGDYITMGGQPEFAFGTGDFTIECWVNPAAFGKLIYDSRSGAEGPNVALYIETDGTIKLSVNTTYRITTRAILANTWTHIALVRSNGITRIYLDGVQSGSSYSDSTVYLNGANRPIIGAQGINPATGQYSGYIDELRVYRGLAKYTSTFLPVQDADTISVPSNYSWTMTGGAGDGLTAASNSVLALGTGDFTMEAWVYINANVADYCGIINLSNATTGSVGIRFGNVGFGYKLSACVNSTAVSTVWSCAVTQTSILGTWTHIAFTRKSGICRLFVNGVVQNINSGANPSTYPYTSFTDTTSVGNASFSAGTVINGYITDARVVKGTALYTAGFTPPPATLSAVSGTTLLTGGSIALVDSSSTAATISTVGNPTVSSTNPFGAGNGWSISFDGSSYFSVPRDCVQFGTGDFTMESWIYPTSTAEMSIFNRTWGGSNFLLCYISGGTIAFWVGHAQTGWVVLTSAASAIITNQWQHIALTRRGTAVNIWVNGVSVASGTCAVNLTNADSTPLLIGRYIPSGVPFSGYISNVRIVNGTALYSSIFTPPTTKLTAISGTVVLTAQNATAVDNSSSALTITAGGNARANASVTRL
jgi:hypothetical protein